jgi:hypothetical protein
MPSLSETALAMTSQLRGATLMKCRAQAGLGSNALTILERSARTEGNRPTFAPTSTAILSGARNCLATAISHSLGHNVVWRTTRV